MCFHTFQVMDTLRSEFKSGKIPSAYQKVAAISPWLRYCSGASAEVDANSLTSQRFLALHKQLRRVLGLRGYYYLAAEYLECRRCSCKVIICSQPFVEQLDLAHPSHFRVILTYKCAFDLEVVRLLRDRGLGNSLSRLYQQLLEEHEDEWLARQLRFLSDSVGFQRYASKPLPPLPEASRPDVPEPPEGLRSGPHSQLDTSKALITGLFGGVLKMDSSNKERKDAVARGE